MPPSTCCGADANGACSPQTFPPHQTVYHYVRTWRCAGVWERMHDSLRGDLREACGRTREPSAGIIDSQMAKPPKKGGNVLKVEMTT
jgi:putative transposase